MGNVSQGIAMQVKLDKLVWLVKIPFIEYGVERMLRRVLLS